MGDFTINQERLDEVVLRICDAAQNRKGIFKQGTEIYLPQHNLPPEMEFSPKREETKTPYEASLFLWTEAFFERRNTSKVIIKSCLDAWKKDRWFFHPISLDGRKIDKVTEVMKRLPYTAQANSAKEAARLYISNCANLIDLFEADPRHMIEGKSAKRARDLISKFHGIGRGIANLYITYLADRKIIAPYDIENCLLKIDVHKARIPINTNALTTTNGEIRIMGQETKALEQAYLTAGKKHEIDFRFMDSAIWILGSEVCPKKDYRICASKCPIVDLCEAYTPSDKGTSKYQLRDKDGKRIDPRSNLWLKTHPTLF